MDNREPYLEDNTARLIQAGFSAEARPNTLTREQTWRHLVAQVHAKRTAGAFPDWSLVILAGILALMAAWLASQALRAGVTVGPLPILVAVVLTLNLVSVPVADIVILIGRRRYA